MRKAGAALAAIAGIGALGAGAYALTRPNNQQQSSVVFPSDDRDMQDLSALAKSGADERAVAESVYKPAKQDRLLWRSDNYEREGTRMARKDYIPAGQSDIVVSETVLPETGEVIVQKIPLRYYAAHVGVPGSGGDVVDSSYTPEQIRADGARIQQVSGPPAASIPGIAWGS